MAEGIAEEQSTDGRTGIETAKKFQEGKLEKHQNSYNGYGFGSSSLQNTTDKSIRKEIDNPGKHRKHTPITSEKQRGLFGAELSRREAGKEPRMPGITTKELRDHLKESKGKKLK